MKLKKLLKLIPNEYKIGISLYGRSLVNWRLYYV